MTDSHSNERLLMELEAVGVSEDTYIKYFLRTLYQLGETLKNTRWSAEEFKETKEKYKVWGRYGWTILGSLQQLEEMKKLGRTDLEIYDEIGLLFYGEDKLDRFMDDICNYRPLKGKKLRDAFNGEQYEYCAMLGFTYIDCELITHTQRKKKQQRSTGEKGFNNLISNTEMDLVDDKAGWLNNLSESIKVLYKYGNDFLSQPPVINRNFVMHGMNELPPGKLDCIKVILCYHGVLMLLDAIAKQSAEKNGR